MVNNFLEQVYFQNRVIDYIIALVIFGTAILTIIILKNFLIGILKRQALKKTTTIAERFVDTV